MLRRLAFCVTFLTVAGFAAVPAQAAPDFSVLVFTKTAGRPRPGSPPSRNWPPRTTSPSRRPRTPRQFTDANLARFKAVIWLSTTGDVLDATQQAAFERYIRAGGGYVGRARRGRHRVRLAVVRRPGRRLLRQPPGDPARRTVRSRTRAHPSTAGLPRPGPAPTSGTTTGPTRARTVHVLATLDESTYTRRQHGRRPPDRLVPAPTTAAAPGTPAWAHHESFSDTELPQPPARWHPVRGAGPGQLHGRRAATGRHGFTPGDPGQGRGRDRRADGPDRAAQPGRAAHLARRHHPLHRRGRQHQGRADHPGLHATTRRVCRASRPTRTSPPTGGSTSTTPRRCAPRAATRRPPARRRSSRRSTASTGWPASPCRPTSPSTRRRR